MSLVRPGCLPSMEGTRIFQNLYLPRHKKSVSHLRADMLNKQAWDRGYCCFRSPLVCAGNVLLTSCDSTPHGFRAKVSDFGLARNLNIQSKIETRTYGTITHMPLELLCDGIMSKVESQCHDKFAMW